MGDGAPARHFSAVGSEGPSARDARRPLELIPLSLGPAPTHDVVSTPVLDVLRERLVDRRRSGHGPAVALLDLSDARFEASILMDLLGSLAREIRSGAFGDVTLVVASDDSGVRRMAEMVATTMDLPMYVVAALSGVPQAEPVGRLTLTERESIRTLSRLHGPVNVSTFASATNLELTAAGNRLNNLAKRGYVHRLARSRREGDQYTSPAAAFPVDFRTTSQT
jgi:hypothetical protein